MDNEKKLALQIMPMPGDANPYGDVFGGWIMSQVDIAGSIPASQLAKGRVSTVAVTSFLFKQPVFIGDLVSFYANITKVGNTSITVEVEVYARRNSFEEDVVKVTEATLVYVAIGEDRKPRPVVPKPLAEDCEHIWQDWPIARSEDLQWCSRGHGLSGSRKSEQ